MISRREEERREQQARKMKTQAQADFAKKNPIWNCLFTLFAVGFLGVLGLLIALGAMGFFDHLG